MITDPNHPAMIRAAADLNLALNRAVQGRSLMTHERQIMEHISDLIGKHRRFYRQRGIEFPEMSALVVRRLGAIELVRADLDDKGIASALHNLRVKYPTATMDELRLALFQAFPDKKPQGFAIFNQ